jgi:PST family polysaccharide transporter
MQRREVEPQHKNAALYFSVLVGIFFYFALFFSAPFIADFYDKPVLQPALRVFGWSFICLSLGSSSLNLLQKNFNFKKVFFSDSLSLFASNIFGIILGFMGYGIWSLVYSVLFYNTSKVIMLWIQEPIPVRLGASVRHWKDLLGYGMSLTLVRLNNYVNGFGISLLIGKLIPLASLGVFERSYRIMNLPGRYIGDMVQKIMMPTMVKHGETDEDLFSIFSRGLSLSNSIMVPLSVFLMVFCESVVLLLLGPNWREAIIPLTILFFNLPFRISVRLSDSLMRVRGLILKNAKRKFQYTIVLCTTIIIGSYWGLIGIAAAVTVSTAQNYFAMLLTIRRRVFPEKWTELMFKPFYSGIKLAIGLTIPSYIIFRVVQLFLPGTTHSFIVLLAVIGVFLLYAFFRNPKLLGKDFAPVQKELMKLINKKRKGGKGGKGKRRKRLMQQEADTLAANAAQIKQVEE